MNYEEKYKEALQAVKELKQINPSDDGLQKWADDHFPELKESEGEKIREALLNEFIHLQSKGYKFAGLEGEEIIAWLEKQGEQKPINTESLDKAIDLYYTTYGNGNNGFDYLSLDKFRDIVHTFIEDYGNKSTWSEEDEKTFRALSKALARISSNTRTDSTSVNYSFFTEIEWLKSLKERMKGE